MLPNSPKKPEPESAPDDPAESERFIDMALELEVEEAPEAFDKAFKKVIKPPLLIVDQDPVDRAHA